MGAAGLDVSIGSDDPPMFGTDIGREYRLAGAALGWDAAAARAFVLATADATFLPRGERAQLRAVLSADLDALEKKFTPAAP